VTRKSKREIEKAIARLWEDDDPSDITVESSVVTVTEDDVDEDGIVDLPEYEPPADAVAMEWETESSVVEAYQVQRDGRGGS
jgi:hypothetical protein